MYFFEQFFRRKNDTERFIFLRAILSADQNRSNININLFLENLVLYKFGFVPMGDSPESIKITITNSDGRLAFIEEFVLVKTLIDTGISKYYTWHYEGDDVFDFNSRDCHMNKKNCNYEMTVQRIGDLKGSVSISLFEVKRTV